MEDWILFIVFLLILFLSLFLFFGALYVVFQTIIQIPLTLGTIGSSTALTL